jgi:phosphotransferase system enzyme I (PtsI)
LNESAGSGRPSVPLGTRLGYRLGSAVRARQRAESLSMLSRVLQGIAVSPGLASAPVHVVHAGPSDVPTWTVAREDVPLEIGRLAMALNAASEVLAARQRLVAQSAGEKDAEIFAVHRMILQDPGALRDVERAIAGQRINAEAAVQLLISRFEASMGKLDGNSVRAFATDVSDPWRLVLEKLLEKDRERVLEGGESVILAAAELTPQVVTFLERGRVLAVVAEAGGRFSHGAVLARSFGVPCVVGLPTLLARLEQGMILAVDGDRGRVQLRPTPEELQELQERKHSMAERRGELREEAGLPAVTPDGARLSLAVNIESERDLDTFEPAHCDGVGLLRTEFLYMERSQFPSEEEQYRLYRSVLERMEGRPVTIRLLDIGGDKPLPYFKTPPETNPALGWRGIRITLQWSDLMRVQLRALLRASTCGNLRILIPMVSSIEEVHEVHRLWKEVRADLARQGYETAPDVPVGSMIEVPSALLSIDRIARAVDFVSVGTNDLVQYLLAVDRDNSWVSSLYDPQHPAVLRALAQVAEAAQSARRPASVCGDLACDPTTALLLLGLGYDGLSVAPQFLPEIKYAVRRTPLTEARQLARAALEQETAEGARSVLDAARARLYRSNATTRAR